MKKLILISLVFLTACSNQPAKEKNSKDLVINLSEAPKTASAEQQTLGQGVEKMKAGSLVDAIENYFDPVVKNCQVNYEGKKKKYFSARSQPEMIMYATMGLIINRDVVVLDSTCGDSYFYKGFALIDLGRIDDAKKSFEKAVEWSPQNASYLSELGNLYQLKKDWKQSIDYFTQAESAAELSPEKIKNDELVRAKRGVGYNLTEMGKLDEAEKKYQECLAIDKNDKKSLGELQYIKQLREKSAK